MQLAFTIVALGFIALGLLIAFAPFTEQDKAVRDAMRYPADKAAMARAIRGDSK